MQTNLGALPFLKRTTYRIDNAARRTARFCVKAYWRVLTAIAIAAIIAEGFMFYYGYQTMYNMERELLTLREAKAQTQAVEEETAPIGKEPQREVKSSAIREITAYNVGIKSQTDGTPCTSANGENICEAVKRGYKRCAANFVPIGTRLQIQNYGECLVTDRMNSRFQNRVDIAMRADEIERAQRFGLQHLAVKVLK